SQPVTVVRRFGIFEFIEISFERLLLLWSATQLEQHVLHREVCGNRAAIVSRRRFWTRVTRERDQRILVDGGGDQQRRSRARTEGGPGARQQYQGADRDETRAFEALF